MGVMSCSAALRMVGSPSGILLGLLLIQVETWAIPLQEAGPILDAEGLTFSSGNGHRGLDSLSGLTFGKQKRNFDEIDRAGFGAFNKRNFDEIDRSGFGGFVKRRQDKRTFDEIDRMGFEGFVKRPWWQKKNFDEIDRVGFGGFGRSF